MAIIRLADAADAGAMLAVYAPYVRDTAISFETEPPSEEEFRQRVRSTLEVGPWLLCEERGRVLGYAYAGRFHPRRAYQWTVEVTAYVLAEHHRKGVALGLYTALLACLALQGFRSAVGVIALPNPASVGLHERVGFAPAGVLRAVGYKHERWHDVGQSPAVSPDGTTVDLYGYASMAVAAIQAQEREIAALKGEVAALRHELDERKPSHR